MSRKGAGPALRHVDVWSLGAVTIAIALVAPLGIVLAALAQTGPEWDHIASTVLVGYIVNTVIVVTVVSALCVVLALPAAWLVTTCKFPGSNIFRWALVLPLALPTYVAGFAYYKIPEAAIPLLVAVRTHYGVNAFQAAESIVRYGALMLAMAGVLFPYLYLAARASFSHACRGALDAAHSLGAPPARAMVSIALPMARPAIVAGLSLVIMEIVNDYGAVHLFGVPTLTEGIFRTWFGLGDHTSALRIAGLVSMAVLTALMLEHRQRGRSRYADAVPDIRTVKPRRLRGAPAVGAVVVCIVPLGLGLLFPVGQLGLWAWWTIGGVWDGEMIARTGNSVMLAAATAVWLGAVSVFLVHATRLHRSAFWVRAASRLSTLGYAMPGAVVAVGILGVFAGIDLWTGAAGGVGAENSGAGSPATVFSLLSGSLVAVGFAYTVRFLAVAHHPVQAGATQVCTSLDDASRSLGRSPWQTLLRINLPLLRPTLFAGGILVFVDVLKELPLTMILRPANFETLATTAFGLAKEGRIHECAVPSLIIVGLSVVALLACEPLLTRVRAIRPVAGRRSSVAEVRAGGAP